MVDDIRVDKTPHPLPEDIVERRYDSAEPLFVYESAKPVLDLTFDVPGVVTDRSPVQNEVKAVGTSSAMGVSGRGLELSGTAYLEAGRHTMPTLHTVPVLDTSVPPLPHSPHSGQVLSSAVPTFGQALTVEAWVNPKTSGAPANLVRQEGAFALIREASEELYCYVFSMAPGRRR
jgi:hypothetical protein